MPRQRRKICLTLPDEFLDLCREDGVTPETVLTGFIADLCGIDGADEYSSNGSDERLLARAYYERVGYPWWHRP